MTLKKIKSYNFNVENINFILPPIKKKKFFLQPQQCHTNYNQRKNLI